MDGTELIELGMREDMMLITAGILFLIAIAAVIIHLSILAKRALERGRIRVESMGETANDLMDNELDKLK